MNRSFDDGIVASGRLMDKRLDEFRALITSDGEKIRRRIDEFAVSMNTHLNQMAECCRALRADSSEMKENLKRLEAGQQRLLVNMFAIESRVASVEKTEKVVLTEMRGLSAKVDRLSRARQPRP